MEKYPIDILTFFNENNELPEYLDKSLERTKEKGFSILPITADSYRIKPCHCGFKHIRDITIPKIEKIINDINGFFIAEGDLYIFNNFNFNEFISMELNKPTWLGYNKIYNYNSADYPYITGNYLIYIPKNYFAEFKSLINDEPKLIFSDRFFSKLFFIEWLNVINKSIAGEIEHYSNVYKKNRKGKYK